MGKHIDLVGKQFSRLTVLRYLKGSKWECKCDCGNIVIVGTQKLNNGNTKSCGCLHKDKWRQVISKHGGRGTRLYRIWQGMITRCVNPNSKSYRYYGNRGVVVCDEWRKDFQSFREWALINGYAENLTIERINNNGNYEPSNCKWATLKEQQNNTRKNHIITSQGESLTLAQMSEKHNIPVGILTNRINNLGWDAESATTSPILIRHSGRRVIRIEDGKEFKTITEAGKETNCDNSYISKACRGIAKTAGGFHWKFANV